MEAAAKCTFLVKDPNMFSGHTSQFGCNDCNIQEWLSFVERHVTSNYKQIYIV